MARYLLRQTSSALVTVVYMCVVSAVFALFRNRGCDKHNDDRKPKSREVVRLKSNIVHCWCQAHFGSGPLPATSSCNRLVIGVVTGSPASLNKRLLFAGFLVHCGSAISVLPPTPKEKRSPSPTEHNLSAANGLILRNFG